MFKFPIGPILTTPPKPTATSRNYAKTTPYQPPLTQKYYHDNASLSHEVTLKKNRLQAQPKKFFFCPNNCKIEIYNCIFFKRHFFQNQIMEVFQENYQLIDIIIKIWILFVVAVALIMFCMKKRPIITCRAKGKNIILY